jgi:hypothetical protein
MVITKPGTSVLTGIVLLVYSTLHRSFSNFGVNGYTLLAGNPDTAPFFGPFFFFFFFFYWILDSVGFQVRKQLRGKNNVFRDSLILGQLALGNELRTSNYYYSSGIRSTKYPPYFGHYEQVAGPRKDQQNPRVYTPYIHTGLCTSPCRRTFVLEEISR